MATGWQQPMPSLEYDYGYDEMSEWLDIGPTVEEEAGWGVDEGEYTTTIDYSKFTPEQIRQAEMIARQISHEQKQYGESRHFDKSMRDRRKQGNVVRHDAAVGVHSAEDAIELLRIQKERQAQGVPLATAPLAGGCPAGPATSAPAAPAPGYDELGAVSFLRSELQKCAVNIKLYGNPPPQHAARFLMRLGADLLQFLPNPPPDVKAQVLSSFAQVGWDVRIRQPLKGSHPPNGQQLTSLVFGCCCFFCARTGQQLPPASAGIVELPAAQPAAPVRQQVPAPPVAIPQPRQSHSRGKGGSYPAPKPRPAGKGGGQNNTRIHQPQQRGYNNSGQGGEGKGGSRRRAPKK